MTSENNELRDYFDHRFSEEDPLLNFIRNDSRAQGLPDIHIPIYMGKFLYLMAKIQCAKKILEIGTLGAYSTTWLARALPADGKLISLEISPANATIAREHVEKAGLTHCVDIRVGHGVELLALLSQRNEGPFDFFFLDADKENNVLYLDWAIHLSRPGSLILIDNIIPRGEKVGKPCSKEAVQVYAFNDYLAQHPSIEVVPIPTLSRGRFDGMAMARIK